MTQQSPDYCLRLHCHSDLFQYPSQRKEKEGRIQANEEVFRRVSYGTKRCDAHETFGATLSHDVSLSRCVLSIRYSLSPRI